MLNKIGSFFTGLYKQLINMDDSPQRIAFSFGMGVFLGILPGTGALAALAVAFIFRLNKAAALLGCVLTNAWLSIVTFVLAIKIGAAVLGMDWIAVKAQAQDLWNHFTWKSFLDVSVMSMIKPLLIGYSIVGFLCGVAAYLSALFFLKRRKRGT